VIPLCTNPCCRPSLVSIVALLFLNYLADSQQGAGRGLVLLAAVMLAARLALHARVPRFR